MSLLSVILPDPQPIIPNDPTAEDRPLKLLLPSLLQCRNLLGFEVVFWSPVSLALVVTSRDMLLRQKGQAGAGKNKVVGFGLLWQHTASVHWAHI